MHGADYLSALPGDTKEELLQANPYLPYSVVTKGFDSLEDDINLGSIDTGSECVMVYDMDKLSDSAIVPAENMLIIGRDRKYFMSKDSIEDARKANADKIAGLTEEISLINEKLATYQEDLAFVTRLVDARYTGAEDRERELNQALLDKKDELEELKTSIKVTETELKNNTERYGDLQQSQQKESDRRQTFVMIEQLSDLARPEEQRLAEYKQRKSDLVAKLSGLQSDVLKWSTTVGETESKLAGLTRNIEDISTSGRSISDRICRSLRMRELLKIQMVQAWLLQHGRTEYRRNTRRLWTFQMNGLNRNLWLCWRFQRSMRRILRTRRSSWMR